ncbi:MAG: aminotransferase class V-fold PLP-dependent enzyme [Gemmatimonadetes bacterium]|nr:aminotransferase class V-fold PLP-dependent enzyme [Gemmatimonadota bacterium]MYC91161.1 aminotransferase class V-fold PLP-dependent enzyme [Gemmatimonadota bacterium]MYG37085.1 aminotransferase class V-fold PLP-dependent enzyme [Gemmatimonadota bacterium]
MNPEIRALFPGAEEQVYLDISARALVPEPVRAAIADHLRTRMLRGGDKDAMRAVVEETRSSFAELIGAHPDEIAITKNVSEGLNLFGTSLPWEAGDNVVLCPALEHPNNIYLWHNLARLRGIEVRSVAPDGGHVPVDAMRAAMDRRTRLVTVPSVSFAPGFITDVRGIAAAARRVGAVTLVDAAQSIGSLRTDVEELGIDALAVATQKCLLAEYGFGFLYVRRELADTLVPVHLARFGVALDAHETAYVDGELRYALGALRFDVGNYNYLGAAAAGAALELLESWGIGRVERFVRHLAADLADRLAALDLPVAGGRSGSHLAHIVCVGKSGGGRHYSADDPAMNSLHRHLKASGIRLAIRSGVLRFSVGVYNNDEDISRVVEAAREWRARRS